MVVTRLLVVPSVTFVADECRVVLTTLVQDHLIRLVVEEISAFGRVVNHLGKM